MPPPGYCKPYYYSQSSLHRGLYLVFTKSNNTISDIWKSSAIYNKSQPLSEANVVVYIGTCSFINSVNRKCNLKNLLNLVFWLFIWPQRSLSLVQSKMNTIFFWNYQYSWLENFRKYDVCIVWVWNRIYPILIPGTSKLPWLFFYDTPFSSPTLDGVQYVVATAKRPDAA